MGRIPQPVHRRDDTAPAPEDLEPLRSFLSLHDHEEGRADSLPPAPESLRWWLGAMGLVDPRAKVRGADLAWALRVREALVAQVRANIDGRPDPAAIRLLDRAARDTGLRPSFAERGEAAFHVDASGARGAVGQILGRAFLAEVDGRWDRFRICGDPGCGTVFYDRSSNRTGRWCSMAACGNRAKVRAFRERQAAT